MRNLFKTIVNGIARVSISESAEFAKFALSITTVDAPEPAPAAAATIQDSSSDSEIQDSSSDSDSSSCQDTRTETVKSFTKHLNSKLEFYLKQKNLSLDAMSLVEIEELGVFLSDKVSLFPHFEKGTPGYDLVNAVGFQVIAGAEILKTPLQRQTDQARMFRAPAQNDEADELAAVLAATDPVKNNCQQQ